MVMNKIIFLLIAVGFLLFNQNVFAQSIVSNDPKLIEEKIFNNIKNGIDKYHQIGQVYYLKLESSEFQKAKDLKEIDFIDFTSFLTYELDDESQTLKIITDKSDQALFMQQLEILLNEKDLPVKEFFTETVLIN